MLFEVDKPRYDGMVGARIPCNAVFKLFSSDCFGGTILYDILTHVVDEHVASVTFHPFPLSTKTVKTANVTKRLLSMYKPCKL